MADSFLNANAVEKFSLIAALSILTTTGGKSSISLSVAGYFTGAFSPSLPLVVVGDLSFSWVLFVFYGFSFAAFSGFAAGLGT
jgi:hypothetical protein